MNRSAFFTAKPQALAEHNPLETIRAIAVLMLVSYHVVGPTANAGLQIEAPHILRLSSEFLVDVRMPVFAFLAGYIYAIRPLSLSQYPKFVKGKFLRIYVPGAVASILFLLVSNVMGTDFARPVSEAWRVLISSYAHFWFLQSICLIFLIYGLFDAMVSGRFAPLVFIVACVVYIQRIFPGMGIMSWNGATYLFPYFMLGVICFRYRTVLRDHATAIAFGAVLVMLSSSALNIWTYFETGDFTASKRDLQSLAMGVGTSVFALLCLPRLHLLEKIRPYALTIYLYHVFATSFSRRIWDVAGLEDIWLRWLLGLAAGLAMPILLHLVVQRIPPVSRVMLGR
ncbi:acyltransferase [uncultured Roseobacter sp.]|uniref:acyltransferase family protein n=1 Tax=uncultured Roseobacter sp. TaxID=114847 RepID=UPI00262A793C|nr:acyltransferase [uncultured Roseobacter sp.]